MKKMKLSTKAVLSLILSAILFSMPVISFSLNRNYTAEVQAAENEDTVGEGAECPDETESNLKENEETVSGGETGADVLENESESGTDGKEDEPAPVCTCEEKCGRYEYNKDCEVCAADYLLCEYKTPNVSIKINVPDGWFKESTTVTIRVTDLANTGNFEVAKIQAKIGQNGGWTDVTEDRKLHISENCTIYVQVTDQKGNTYERNRPIRCFDTTKPTLNAAVSNGLLTIQVHDTDSGARVIYVNGYEFTDLTNGTLNIRLQQFDAGYEYFTIYAMDNAGNVSEVYKTKNPYYKDPKDESDDNPAKQLPESAEATKPGSATGTVTEHTVTDSRGNTVSETGKLSHEEQKRQAMAEADAAEAAENSDGKEAEESQSGKEFYTIQTASDKVFYLIIDRDGDEEMVYFLTEITENDLLNTTSDNSETLPKNSAALESAIPVTVGALPNNNGAVISDTQQDAEQTEEPDKTQEDSEGEADTEPESGEQTETVKKSNPTASYIIMGILGAVVIGGGYYFKVVRKKKEDFIEDEDGTGDEDDGEEFENEDDDDADAEMSSDEAFLQNQEDEAE